MKRLMVLFSLGLLLGLCSTAQGVVHDIDILDFVFDPPGPTIAPGDTVRWTLVNGTHTTTALPESPKQWDSGIMDVPGQTFEVVFHLGDGPGPFPYYSAMDEGIMDGIISTWDTCFATGDFDGDGNVLTVSDLVYLLRVILGQDPWPDNLYQADLNGDCTIDAGDMEMWDCYFVYGMSCFPNGFPVPTCCFPDTIVGACCFGDSCSIRSEENCAALGGSYLGDGTDCEGDNPCCCIGIRGNINGDPNDLIDVSDLTYFVEALFACGSFCFWCDLETDANGDGGIDIADLVYIVDYLFNGGPPPVACPY